MKKKLNDRKAWKSLQLIVRLKTVEKNRENGIKLSVLHIFVLLTQHTTKDMLVVDVSKRLFGNITQVYLSN